ncbi:MAG: response regulator transcription factor [Bacteroidales bacterium]|nr:response regulator transcription factor [Bacteroidales bacterium]MBN2764182.1 response regulator transcription factor [Bacteroidales bacterium]
MSKIKVGIYDEHKLTQVGIGSLLKSVEDIEITLQSNEKAHLLDSLNSICPNILIINLHELNSPLINLISQISTGYPQVRILIVSVKKEEDIILKTIKAGAKGFLSKDSEKDELIEAIYTLRSGYDYYNKSITHLLLNKYIHQLKTENESAGVKNLSIREIEIMKLWGNSLTNKEIAEKLYLSVRTVETHKNHIMQKLNLKTSVDLVKYGIKNNIIEI